MFNIGRTVYLVSYVQEGNLYNVIKSIRILEMRITDIEHDRDGLPVYVMIPTEYEESVSHTHSRPCERCHQRDSSRPNYQ
jgi:hypothetical protein